MTVFVFSTCFLFACGIVWLFGARVARHLSLVVPVFLLIGCVQPDVAWVRADRDTYQAVAGVYLHAIESDSTYVEEDVEASRELVYGWARNVEVNYAVLDLGQPELQPSPDSLAVLLGLEEDE